MHVRLHYLLKPVERVGHADKRVLSVYREHGVIQKDSRDDNYNKTPENLSRYQLVVPGDLVVNKMKAWSGSVGVSRFEGIVSPDYLVCVVSEEVHPGYLHYALRSANLVAEMRKRSKGIRPSQERLYWDDLAEIPLMLPPLEEQWRIAEFLDNQVTLLDRAIALRRQQKKLLAEREQARVYTAIRGFRCTESRASVGTRWISDVPSSWTVQPLGRRFDIQLGKMLAPDRVAGNHLRPYLRNTNVQWDRIDTTDLLYMNFPPGERVRYEVLPGDLLVCEGGDIGRAAIWDGSISEVYYQKALHRVRAVGETSVRWVYYILRAATRLDVFQVEGGSATISHLTGEQLRAHRVPFPPAAVERGLVKELDEAAAEDARLVALYDRQVELIQERKQALITAAVTGQFDVTTARSAA